MKSIMLSNVDLNLLRMLVAIADTGSVSKAGERLGLSQPAASNALNRLRHTLGDPLFVRTRHGMKPTHFAEKILPDIEHHMSGIFDALGRDEFDPANSSRRFRLSLSGLGEVVFLPRLLERALDVAPNVRFSNATTPAPTLAEELEQGKIDLAVGMIDIRARGIRTSTLFAESYVAIAGPDFAQRVRTPDDLKQQRLIVSAPVATYAADIEELLAQHELTESVVLRLAHFGVLPPILRKIGAVAIVPRQLAADLCATGQAQILSLDLDWQASDIKLVWSERTDADAGCTWLRGLMIELFADRSGAPQS